MDGRIFKLKKAFSERLSHVWTVGEIANSFDMSASHFQKLFKTQTGIPPMTYLRELRLEQARKLLETTFLQIKQIGVRTGLTNDSYFTRDFKRKYGSTPTEYRKQYWEELQSKEADEQE